MSTSLHNVAPEDVASYLAAKGWRRNGQYGKTTVWTRPESDYGVDLLLPFSREFRDYAERLSELIDAVAEHEQRDPGLVLQDLLEPRTDVQYIHTYPDAPSGSAPLHEGFKAVKGVHDLFLAAATVRSLDVPPAVLPSSKPRQAWDFLRGVRLGQTMPGSYVLRVETPLTSDDHADGLSSRSVLAQLYQSIAAAHSAAQQNLDYALARIGGHIESGVSANVCQALHEIGGRDSSSFTIQFTWARAEPMQEETPSVSFDAETITSVRRLGEQLRELSEFRQARLVGRVVELRRRHSRGGGTVTLDGTLTVNRRSRSERISVELNAHDYDLALDAHRRALPLQVDGNLRTSGRQPIMQEATFVQLLVPPADR